ncbi:hypothetical protein CYMTET_21409 [Cymbomonas tetramitiformis]|uniref:Uncharacterized protein n=1 Tax=Cymbomonas tetramitiformis TaxID=36881 RepID=A0AAE0L393_9CHLO|nr:hypothetical protein CYMTET_21409 [Cymbomonas tetramitiformis]
MRGVGWFLDNATKGKEFVAHFDYSDPDPYLGITFYGRKYGCLLLRQRRAAGHSDSGDPHGRDNRGDRKKTAARTTSSRELTEVSDNDATDESAAADDDDDDDEPFDIKSAIAVTDKNREEMKKKGMHVVYSQKRFI